MKCLEADGDYQILDGLRDQNVQIKEYFFQGYVKDVVFTYKVMYICFNGATIHVLLKKKNAIICSVT